MPTVQYRQNFEIFLDKAKDKIPKQCRIGDTCLTSLATIEGTLITINSMNLNHVHKKAIIFCQ